MTHFTAPHIRVRRSQNPSAISPFILDATQIKPDPAPSGSRHAATWLHIPVICRHVASREEALLVLRQMTRIRHPNIEQLLGVVAEKHAPCYVVTERVNGACVADLIAKEAWKAQFGKQVVADVARALLYLHNRGVAHGGVCVRNVMFDDGRERAVLLMGEGGRQDVDVKMFGRFVKEVLGGVGVVAMCERGVGMEMVCKAVLRGSRSERN